jgi:hypothetical protein
VKVWRVEWQSSWEGRGMWREGYGRREKKSGVVAEQSNRETLLKAVLSRLGSAGSRRGGAPQNHQAACDWLGANCQSVRPGSGQSHVQALESEEQSASRLAWPTHRPPTPLCCASAIWGRSSAHPQKTPSPVPRRPLHLRCPREQHHG